MLRNAILYAFVMLSSAVASPIGVVGSGYYVGPGDPYCVLHFSGSNGVRSLNVSFDGSGICTMGSTDFGVGTATIDGITSRRFRFYIAPENGYVSLLDSQWLTIATVPIFGSVTKRERIRIGYEIQQFVDVEAITPEPGTAIAAVASLLIVAASRWRVSRNC
jgi:hypothetical protein